ncbi:uncharacterized protein UHOD_12243 [Ustilago sp. UG-2017b]|nr:uncharacterized protein UHOD_12243 [Ustilago sp. UG-2017b]
MSQGNLIAMKLSGMFRIGFVAAIVTALILLPSCIAAGDSNMAGTSTSNPDHPSTEPPRPVFNTRKYIESLNPQTIADLGESKAGTYDKVPFYKEAPLYSIDTPAKTVRQALRDYGSFGIVDAPNNKARLIKSLGNGDLEWDTLRYEESDMINLFKNELNPDLHYLRHLVRSGKIDGHTGKDIDHLPYANGKPILFEDSETLDHMIRAAKTEPKSFYYAPKEKDPILIDPGTDKLIGNHIRDEEKRLRRVVVGYKSTQEKQGQPLASIIWGKPMIANHDSEGPLTSKIRQTTYQTFRHDDPKEDMVAALQHNGRFRVYKEIDGKKYEYKVKVVNPRAEPGEAFKFSIEPVSTTKRLPKFLRFW